jgi:GNAT superfamily N-acetyltransferase
MDGLQLRPYAGEADVAEIVGIANAEFAADGVPIHFEVANMLAYYRHATDKFDPARDVTLASVDDDVVAFGSISWIDTNDGLYREFRVDGRVLPAAQRRGIGSALLHHNEECARSLAKDRPTDRTLTFGTWSGDTQVARTALLEANGYQPVRWFFDMTRPNLDAIDEPPLPGGLDVRPVTAELIHQIWRADVEAFRDHWGGGDDSKEALQRYIDSPDHDASLWLIAWDGDEVAGGVINGIERGENEALGLNRGWLHSVFTRRQWRKRGLASALIAQSLKLLRDRGMTSAVLGVDADNPTGALALYERAGFEVSYRSTAWRKPLDPA